jgi:SpoVK/Ycf46/Vps4 family AAA+-type ATPase
MGFFKVKSAKTIDSLQEGDIVPESDYAIFSSQRFVQFEYIEPAPETQPEYEVNPGVFCIKRKNNSLVLEPTSFVKDEILDSFVHTKDIETRIDCFFNKFNVYKRYGIEIPKRNILLYGPPGTGKSTAISKISNKYVEDKKTLIVIYQTDCFDAAEVKNFIKSFSYKNIEKQILIMEDIGGVEIDEVRVRSDSSLLSLLDNNEKAFKIPTLVISTTNHPEVFLGNLTNRPGRFDDKIQVGFPSGEQRARLLEFFLKDQPNLAAQKLLSSIQFEDFSPAHIKECVIRSAIYDKQLEDVLKEMKEEIKLFKDAFQKKRSMGMSDF